MISRKPVTASASRLRILNGSLFDRLVADEEDIRHLAGMDVDRAQIALTSPHAVVRVQS
jgi:hypothetical protein